jgi:predicted ATPase/DNA-binding SARP family transcriptional activator
MLRIYLFGAFRYTIDDQPQKLHALPKSLSLCGYLLLHAAPVPRDRLAALLWPEAPEQTARANLRRHLHDLRRALPPAPDAQPWLLVDNATVQWNPAAAYWLDVTAFERATHGDPPVLESATAAVQLYTGDLLQELYDDWIFFERERLRSRCLDTLRWLIQHHRDRQNIAQAIAFCRQLLELEPLAEDVVRDLISLRVAAGDRAGAMLEYRRLRDRLRDEMGLAPMLETEALYDQIARQSFAAASPGAPPAAPVESTPAAPPPASSGPRELSGSGALPSNLPAQLTSFVGREHEMAALRTLLTNRPAAARLITLTGPGGSGKTRLALETGARLRAARPPAFPAGIYFVPLVTVTDPAFVIPAIVNVLEISDSAGRSALDAVKETLRGRRMLLIIDNFEHLLEAAPTLGELLRAAPDLMLLVTSRAALRMYGEQEFPVAPLPLPDLTQLPPVEDLPRFAAVSLFLTRSRAVNPAFALTAANAADIAEICVGLDGLPLAIELAAARSRLLDAAALRARLEDGLTFFQNRDRSPHERHQTLRATLEWSYHLLESETQQIFSALSIFAGSFSLEAAEAVCGDRGDIFAGLEALIDNSLLRQMEPDADVDPVLEALPRYRMLALIRAYARSILDTQPDADEIARRHAAFYAQLAQESEAPLRGGGQIPWLQRLAWDHDNIRAALRWALAGDAARAVVGLELAGRLGQFWFLAGHFSEGQRWIRAALEKAGDAAPVAARSLAVYALGALLQAQGDLRQAEPFFEQALELYRAAGDTYGITDALYALGRQANRRQDYAAAEQLLQASLALAQAVGNTFRIGYIYNIQALIRLAHADIAGAEMLYSLALESARRIDNKSGLAFFLTGVGELARQRGDYGRAEAIYYEAMHLAEQLHQKDRKVMLLHNLAYVVLQRDNPRRAAALFRQCLRLGQELPDKENFGMCLLGLGAVAVVDGDLPRAVQLFGAGRRVLDDLGASLAPADQIEYDRAVSAARARLDTASYVCHFEHGRQLTPEAAESLALDEH